MPTPRAAEVDWRLLYRANRAMTRWKPLPFSSDDHHANLALNGGMRMAAQEYIEAMKVLKDLEESGDI